MATSFPVEGDTLIIEVLVPGGALDQEVEVPMDMGGINLEWSYLQITIMKSGVNLAIPSSQRMVGIPKCQLHKREGFKGSSQPELMVTHGCMFWNPEKGQNLLRFQTWCGLESKEKLALRSK
ncbi:hypothetical protein RHMOL_Rhmol09G0094100 [Rhododendron molle]|uniref:Uncharacterized protein n=1 Tax=Rhododendron molle TaxID=49168 RepID=A0ACC0MCM7_RHOML|nr:hypothetical protein RHMOL_Rhmol09G0094100 [Rhododendron molle]